MNEDFPAYPYLNELASRIHADIDEVAEKHQMSVAEILGLLDMVKEDILFTNRQA